MFCRELKKVKTTTQGRRTKNISSIFKVVFIKNLNNLGVNS